MFKEDTLLILGAGASTCYGYPLRKELIEQIVDCVTNDIVYIRLQQYIGNKQSADQIDRLKFKLSCVIENSVRLNENDLGESNEKIVNVPSSAGYYSCAAVPLRNIEELCDLSEALQQFDPVSIDAFLNNHPSHALAGKIKKRGVKSGHLTSGLLASLNFLIAKK
ncbi:MAG TPA: hypothetical protein VFU82_05760 [Gammaproteobacteria bacterium]|nr:hypothetical protein [Gammaproteobacteria bacterium]